MIRLFSFCSVVPLLFVACGSPGPTAGGGNDFPNPHTSVALIGESLAENLSSSAAWSDSVEPPVDMPDITGGANVKIPSIPSGSLGKRLAVTESLSIDLSDTLLGIVRLIYSAHTDTSVKRDTITVLYDDAYDGIPDGTEHIYSITGADSSLTTGIVERYGYTDRDGDSIINSGVTENSVTIHWAHHAPSGLMSRAELVIDAGEDNDLDTDGDNRIRASDAAVTLNGDTIFAAAFIDADGDGVIVEQGSSDSCLAEVMVMQQSESSELLIERTTFNGLYVVYPTDSTLNYPLRWRITHIGSAGIVTETRYYGTGPDSIILPGDTAYVHRVVDRGTGVTTNVDTLSMVLVTGSNPRIDTDDSLLSLSSRQHRSLGLRRTIRFDLKLDMPLRAGMDAESGTIEYAVTYRDGYAFTLSAVFDSTEITASYIDTEENSRTLSWDRSGEPLP